MLSCQCHHKLPRTWVSEEEWERTVLRRPYVRMCPCVGALACLSDDCFTFGERTSCPPWYLHTDTHAHFPSPFA